MTRRTELEIALDRYLAEGPEMVPDRVIDDALREIDHTTQRRARGVPWRIAMPNAVKLAAAAAVIIVLGVGSLAWLNRPAGNVGAPSETPAASPAATPSVEPSPPAAAAVPAEGYLAAGTWVADAIQPTVTFELDREFEVLYSAPGTLVIEERGLARDIAFVNPAGVIDTVTGERAELPADLAGWLAAQPGLDMSAPTPVTIGDRSGLALEGTPRPDAAYDASGRLPLFSVDGVDDFFVPSDVRFRIAVLDVDGAPLVVAVLARADRFEDFGPTADAILEGLVLRP